MAAKVVNLDDRRAENRAVNEALDMLCESALDPEGPRVAVYELARDFPAVRDAARADIAGRIAELRAWLAIVDLAEKHAG